MMKEVLYKLSYMLFPRRCEICGEVVEFDMSRCENCETLDKITGEVCEYCGHSKEVCVCKKHKMEYKRIISPYYYNDKLFAALHRFKFNNFPELAKGMGKEIADCVAQRYDDIDFDCVTFIPLTKKRQSQRGYNQAELLAREVSKNIGVPVENLLYKLFDNKSQRTQSAKERKVNVYAAYDLIENIDVTDKTILIIDDVKTTGSTLNECAKMLNIYGCKAVYAASFAITKNEKENNSD